MGFVSYHMSGISVFSFSTFVWLFDVKKKKGPGFLSSTESTYITTSQTCVVLLQILADHVQKLTAYKCMLTTLSVNLFLFSS